MAAYTLETAVHKPDWQSLDYVASRVRLVVDELRRFPSLKEMEELGRFKDPRITIRSGFADIVDAIKENDFSLEGIYASLGGSSYLKAKEVSFPYPHQVAAAVMAAEKKRMLVVDEFRTGKTGIIPVTQQYLEANVLNQMTQEQEQKYENIAAMPWSSERQELEELLYQEVAVERAPVLAIVPNSAKAGWRRMIEGYLSVPKTIVTINSDAIFIDRTREGERLVLKGDRLANVRAALEANPDYVIVSYNMVFRSAKNGKSSSESGEMEDRKIFELLGEYPFKILAPDEVHNARNRRALRTKAVRKLASGIEYFIPLSGYPAPNKVIKDLSQLAAMIDSEHYDVELHPDTAVDFEQAYRNHPELVRDFVLMHSKPRTSSADIGIEVSLKREDIVIDLEGVHARAYEKVRRSRELDPSSKLLLLRFGLLDPTLLHPDYYPGNSNMRRKLQETFADDAELLNALSKAHNVQGHSSSVYRAADKIIADAVLEEEKTLVFATLKNGVTKSLQEHYARMGLRFHRIDGDIATDDDEEIGDREKIRLDVQTNPEVHGLITNRTMAESINLDGISNQIRLDLPVDPGTEQQLSARHSGPYQKKGIGIYNIIPRNTIARGIQSMLRDKQLLIDLVFLGHQLTPEQMRRLEEGNITRHPHLVESISPTDLLNSYFRRMRGRGYLANTEFLNADDGLNAQRFAESYDYDWEHSYSAQTNRLIVKNVLEPLSRNGQIDLTDILDLAGGNYALARILLGETRLQFDRITNVDFNRYQLEFGERNARRILQGKTKYRPLELESIVDMMHDLSFAPDGRFGVSVCSLGFHYAALNIRIDEVVDGKVERKAFREREQIAREAVRVTKNGGYMIFALPPSAVDAEGQFRFTEAMQALGVEPVHELIGMVKATAPADSDYRSFLWVGRKRGYRDARMHEDAFVLNTTMLYSNPSQRNGKARNNASYEFPSEICTGFEFATNQKPVTEMAASYLRRTGQVQMAMNNDAFDAMRRSINQHTAQLRAVRQKLKEELLDALGIIESSPDRIAGQRNRIKRFMDEIEHKPYSQRIQEELKELLEQLGRL